MDFKKATIIEFFDYLKTNPAEHAIPKRYVNRIRNLSCYYFQGHHTFSENELVQEDIVKNFQFQKEPATLLKTVDYQKFAAMPRSGELVANHLKTVIVKFL
jgi:hypothetical protein